MKVFISEYICGGGWPEPVLPASLAAEGAAMLRAVCEDVSRLPGVAVTTTCDVRCPVSFPKAVTVIPVHSAVAEADELLRQAGRAEVTLVIAPELDNVLARRIGQLRSHGVHVLAARDEWLELCSDKLMLAAFLRQHQIPTIPTGLLSSADLLASTAWHGSPERSPSPPEHVVIKPRYGAGSQSIRVVPWAALSESTDGSAASPFEQLVVQPYCPGRAVSVGVVANRSGDFTLLPVAQQTLSTDGSLQYLGGSMPWAGAACDPIRDIVHRCFELLDRPAGYMGFDFVVPDNSPAAPLLVEINPRVCTSYLGYRQLTDENLAARFLLGGPRAAVVWQPRHITFQADGTVPSRSLPESSACV